jgi:cell division protein FtsW
MNVVFKYLKGDRVIWVVTLLLALLSILIVYSSTSQLSYRYKGGDTESYMLKHTFIIALGFLVMVYLHKIKFNYFSRLSQIGVIASIGLLFITLLMGTNVNSASRWIFGFQPSDLAKLTLIVYLARQLSLNKGKLDNLKLFATRIMLPIALVCGLILPADFSTSIMLFADCMILIFIANVSLKNIGIVLGSALVAFSLLLLLSVAFPKLLPRANTWTSRLTTWSGEQDADKTYQTDIAKSAIASGGMFGNGPGKGKTKHILPSAWADFIFVSFIEEYGSVLGGGTLILLYLIILFRVIKIASKTENYFAQLLVFGLGFSIVFQAFLNMGVGVNLLPVTGQPLPLISMGGTSILFTCVAFGIILSVSTTVFKDPETETEGGKYATI